MMMMMMIIDERACLDGGWGLHGVALSPGSCGRLLQTLCECVPVYHLQKFFSGQYFSQSVLLHV